MLKKRIIPILIFLILTACKLNNTKSDLQNDDFTYYNNNLKNIPILLSKIEKKLKHNSGYIAVINSSQCSDCGRDGINNIIDYLPKLENLDYVIITENNDFIDSKLDKTKYDIVYDDYKLFYKYGFYYPRQVIFEYSKNTFKTYKVFK